MRRAFGVVALIASVLIAAGCGNKNTESKTEATETTQATTPPTGEGHADPTVVVGSYEDWCEEHGVAESACTRCDASLIPAFKAVNDWDEEHGLPMSQCLKHNPNLTITRPPKPEGK